MLTTQTFQDFKKVQLEKFKTLAQNPNKFRKLMSIYRGRWSPMPVPNLSQPPLQALFNAGETKILSIGNVAMVSTERELH